MPVFVPGLLPEAFPISINTKRHICQSKILHSYLIFKIPTRTGEEHHESYVYAQFTYQNVVQKGLREVQIEIMVNFVTSFL